MPIENDLNNDDITPTMLDDNLGDNDTQTKATNNDGVDTTKTDNSKYPDGFDAETYDLTTSSVKYDAIKAKFENHKKEVEGLQKQNLDLRKIVSKGKAPNDLKDYEMNYKPDSKFEKYYKEDEIAKETLKSFNELAKNTGLNLEQHKAVVDFMNDTLVKAGVFDTRSKEEIEIQKNDWIKNEKAKLGKDADRLIKSDMEFIDNFGGFNEEQKAELKQFIGSGAVGVATINTIRNAIFGSGRNEDIPTDINVGGLADDIALAREYKDDNTTDLRRAEIIQQRIRAGRKGSLL